jgi:CubicO group peptidase (beta-lactamase class C family)
LTQKYRSEMSRTIYYQLLSLNWVLKSNIMKANTFQFSKMMRTNVIILLTFLILSACNSSEPTSELSTSLPRSTPEAENVSAQAIINFIDAVDASDQELHSFMVLRHGKVVAEGWWDPYKSELKHTLYSTSKSFTSTAIGFAVTEGLITVDDKVISFFPDDLPETLSDNLAAMKIKDLLSMGAGQDPEPRMFNSENWVKTFLAAPVVHQPGSEFLYNSAATYMLSAIVTKVTGEKVVDYLRPRLFDPLAIEGMDWEESPNGINSGGWGLRLKTEDMAKFGQLYLQKGKWNGEQIVPEKWIDEATSKKIDQAPNLSDEEKADNDWLQGYCYKFWRSRYNSYRGDGAYGQLIMIFPEKDAVVAITAEAMDMQKEMNLVYDNLLPAFLDEEIEGQDEAYAKLLNRIVQMALIPPVTGENQSLENEISGSKYAFAVGDKKETVSFSFEDGVCKVNEVSTEGDIYRFTFGSGEWKLFETDKPGSNLVPQSETNLSFMRPFKVAGAYSWQDGNILQLDLRYIESPHTQHYTFQFNGDKLVMTIRESRDPGGDGIVLSGEKVK